jgi:hypothetical protein
VGPPFINLSTTDLAILSINACSASALSPVDDDWPEHEGEENFNMHLVHGTDNEAEMDVEFITDGSYNNWEKTTTLGSY